MPSMDGTDTLPAGDATERPDASNAPVPGSRPSPPAQPEHQQIAAEAEEAGETRETRETPGFGALNRQLTQLTEQLGSVHRLIGRIAAERDAFRRQLADLQGIPVEDVPIPPVGAAKEE
jgi:septal ring factor EnvC (AmiA/AmiB activator)